MVFVRDIKHENDIIRELYDKFFEDDVDIENVLFFIAQKQRAHEVSLNEFRQLITIMKNQ